MSKKHLTSCGDCKYQMSGFDGGFFGLPVTCECRIFGETENRKNCRRFEKKITREYLFEKIYQLEKENKQLKKELDNFKPIMFQDIRKGTVILYSKGDIDEEKESSSFR